MLNRVIRTCAVMTLVWAVAAVAGCGGGDVTTSHDQSAKAKLEEVGEMLKSVAADNQKPPARMADLNAVDPMLLTAGPDLRSGELVYVWGTPYATSGDASLKVAAYEKKTPTEGGWVLMQDGTVKRMSAAEFANAPKAKK